MTPITQAVCASIARLRSTASRPFVDTSGIPELFDGDQVALLLQEHNADPPHIHTYSNIIREKTPKIFAALTWLRQPLCIVVFLEHQIYDNKLPIDAKTLQRFVDEAQLSAQFYETQYEYVPHFFERGLHAIIHDEKTVLPFRSIERMEKLDGSFGSISRVSICATYHNLNYSVVRVQGCFMLNLC